MKAKSEMEKLIEKLQIDLLLFHFISFPFWLPDAGSALISFVCSNKAKNEGLHLSISIIHSLPIFVLLL